VAGGPRGNAWAHSREDLLASVNAGAMRGDRSDTSAITPAPGGAGIAAMPNAHSAQQT
jgi:hypothetical protein